MAKILIVDDETPIRRTLRDILEFEGYEVDEAVDGLECVAKVQKEKYDVVITDIKMPKMDGITLMHKLRSDSWGKTVSIIILTNSDLNDANLSSVVADQPTYYLIKSNCSPEEVLDKVNDVLINKKED